MRKGYVVCLSVERNDYALYVVGHRNRETGTPMFDRGTIDRLLRVCVSNFIEVVT